jgi:hypothetical protein
LWRITRDEPVGQRVVDLPSSRSHVEIVTATAT